MKRTPFKRAKRPLGRAKRPRSGLTVTRLKKKLWDECRRIIRNRHGNTCYTCGRRDLEGSNWQTGHYISSSICSAHLRYHLDNLRPQCYNCNINKSGNWLAFEQHLIAEHGKEFPEQLKKLNRETTGKMYDILWYQDKLTEYQQLT